MIQVHIAPYWKNKRMAKEILRIFNREKNMKIEELIDYLRKKYKNETINGVLWKDEIDYLQGFQWGGIQQKPLLNYDKNKKEWSVSIYHYAYYELYEFSYDNSAKSFDIFIDMNDSKVKSPEARRERLKKRFEKYIDEAIQCIVVNKKCKIVFPCYMVDMEDLELTAFRCDIMIKDLTYINSAFDAFSEYMKYKNEEIQTIPIQIAKSYFLDNIQDDDHNGAVSKMWEIYSRFIEAIFFSEDEKSEDLKRKISEGLKLISGMINVFIEKDLSEKYDELLNDEKKGYSLRYHIGDNKKGESKEDIEKRRKEKSLKIKKATFCVLFASFLYAITKGKFLGSRIYFKEKPFNDVFLQCLSESETIELSVPYDKSDDLDFI